MKGSINKGDMSRRLRSLVTNPDLTELITLITKVYLIPPLQSQDQKGDRRLDGEHGDPAQQGADGDVAHDGATTGEDQVQALEGRYCQENHERGAAGHVLKLGHSDSVSL